MNQETEVAQANVPATQPPKADAAEGASPADAGKETTTGSGAPRRRSRGGRGRSTGGSGPKTPREPAALDDGTPAEWAFAAAADPVKEKPAPKPRAPRAPRPPQTGEAAEAGEKPPPRPRAPRAPRPKPEADGSTPEKPRSRPATAQKDESDPDTPEEGETPATTAARRRRRRGGRGRGRGGSTAAAALDEDAPLTDSVQTQRDDATPDEPEAKSAAPRRRRSPASGSKAATPKTGEAKPAARSRRSDNADVAAGGPTRIRSSRSRTGGSSPSGRRRREPLPYVPRVTDKLMVITEHGDRDQIAVMEERTLVQHYVTRTGATSMVGNVYLGRVQNVLPGMEAAFVDIGRGRNGVLYAGEVNYSPEDLEGPAPRIEHVLKNGQAVMVQVTKDPMGGKGARLTAQISMPGRFLVMVPDSNVSGISRRLPDEERKRLKAILKKIKPDQHGIIVRTAAEGSTEEAFTADLRRLELEWEAINKRAKKVKAPEVLYEEPELTVRVFRDLFTNEEFRELVTDSPRVHEKIMEYVRSVAPDLEPKITLHQGKLPAFEEHHIVEQIHKALDRKVWLPSGGYLIIERTEAMTIVDVNTGKSVGKTNLEETVVNTNLEAASEVARQLRLRDIGGIIVVDFIDMLLEKNKKKVEDTMKEALAVDKTRSQVFEIGPLGLMQVTRKRVSGGLVESFSETCPTCEGRGILVNYEA